MKLKKIALIYSFIFFLIACSSTQKRLPNSYAGVASNQTCTQITSSIINQIPNEAHPVIRERQLRYVSNVEDFYTHMYVHVGNVNRLGEAMIQEVLANPEEWRIVFGIPEGKQLDPQFIETAKKFLTLHDASKLRAESGFYTHHNREKPIIVDLYQLFGKNKNEISPEEQRIIPILNDIDKSVRKDFLQEHKLEDWEINFLDRLEKLSDGIDRGMNPLTAEEMAKIPFKESEFINSLIEAAVAASKSDYEITALRKRFEFVRRIESRYFQITRHYSQSKEKLGLLQQVLSSMNISSVTLRPFSINQVLSELEGELGELTSESLNGWQKNLSEKFKDPSYKNNFAKKYIINVAN